MVLGVAGLWCAECLAQALMRHMHFSVCLRRACSDTGVAGVGCPALPLLCCSCKLRSSSASAFK